MTEHDRLDFETPPKPAQLTPAIIWRNPRIVAQMRRIWAVSPSRVSPLTRRWLTTGHH